MHLESDPVWNSGKEYSQDSQGYSYAREGICGNLISLPTEDLSLPMVCAIAVLVEPFEIPVRIIRRSSNVK